MSQVSLASVSRPATGRRGSIEVGVEHAVIMEKPKIYSMINKIQKTPLIKAKNKSYPPLSVIFRRYF
jgi:hypothetical protein